MAPSRVKAAEHDDNVTRSRSSSESSSDQNGESHSRASSPVERVEVDHNGSRKRRRLSPTTGSDSDSEDASSKVLPALPAPSTASRIKTKQSTSAAQQDEGVPASIIESQMGHEKTSFASLDVDPWLVASLANMAIKNPTGIQRGCIPEILKGRDCIGGSRTGSGKTVAFAVPILQKWAQDPVGIFAVVLTPTR